MLDHQISALLCRQITEEFYSAYFYLSFSNYYCSEGLAGFSNWYRVQAQEERDHAMLFLQYLQNNNAAIELGAIPAPECQFDGFEHPLKAALGHEKYVSSLINTMYETAYNVKDFRTMQFLDWFVKEQGEEENSAETLIQKYQLFGGDAKGLYLLDSELGARVYAPPTLTL